MLWTQKYAPQTTKDVIGQEKGVAILQQFVQQYPQKKKGLLVYGPSGCGKTTSVYAVARERGDELLEVNASDTRNAAALEQILGHAIKQRSLFGKRKVILVDELDGLSGMDDRGGVNALLKLMEESIFPMILVTADPYDRKLSSLRSKCMVVEFSALSPASITKLLLQIAADENITATENACKSIARKVGGDARAAVTDIQVLTEKTRAINIKEIETLGERRQTESMMKALMKILKTTDPAVAGAALDAVDEDLDEVMLWVDENVPKEYKNPKDLARTYKSIAKADIFKSRIRRWQYWRFLTYVHTLLTSGVAVGKEEKYVSFVPYSQPQRLLKIWRLNMKNAKKKSIAEKLAAATHSGTRRAMKHIPYFKHIKEIEKTLELTPEEIDWLKRL